MSAFGPRRVFVICMAITVCIVRRAELLREKEAFRRLHSGPEIHGYVLPSKINELRRKD
jgi:hypothetical protein